MNALVEWLVANKPAEEVDPRYSMEAVEPYLDRFIERIERDLEDTNGCWKWNGAVNPQGYGTFRMKPYGTVGPHCLAYFITYGNWDRDLELDHLCRNSWCVNPDHLEPVTHAENMRRAQEAHTHCARGHEYSLEILYVWRETRACRPCRNLAAARYRARRRQLRQPKQYQSPNQKEGTHHDRFKGHIDIARGFGGRP